MRLDFRGIDDDGVARRTLQELRKQSLRGLVVSRHPGTHVVGKQAATAECVAG